MGNQFYTQSEIYSWCNVELTSKLTIRVKIKLKFWLNRRQSGPNSRRIFNFINNNFIILNNYKKVYYVKNFITFINDNDHESIQITSGTTKYSK